jgi:transposase-like protein
MDVHQNARTTPRSRAEIVRRVQAGQAPGVVAAAMGVSEPTVRKWVARYHRSPPTSRGAVPE